MGRSVGIAVALHVCSSQGWAAMSVDGRGNYLQETLGNGIKTNYAFDPTTGRLAGVAAGVTLLCNFR